MISPHEAICLALANGGLEKAGEFLVKALETVRESGYLVGMVRNGDHVFVSIVDPARPDENAGIIAWPVEDVRRAIGTD